MAGLLDFLQGLGINPGPVATQNGEVTGPVNTGGILGQFQQRLRDASPELMGFGMGMLSGGNQQEGFANAMQGMNTASRTAMLQRQQDMATQEKLARRTAAANFIKANPALAQKYGLDPSDPEAVSKIRELQFGVDNRPDKNQIVQGADGYYAINASDPTQKPVRLGVPLAKSGELKPINQKMADGSEVTIGFQDGSGRTVSLEEAQQRGLIAPQTGTSGLGMAGTKEMQQDKGKRVSQLLQSAQDIDATAAAADQTGKFIRDYVPDSAVGPVAGSAPNRWISGVTGIGGEKQRQLMETQLNDLGLQFRRSVYQGTGAVSDKETAAALSVIGSPQSYDKQTVQAAVEHLKSRTEYKRDFVRYFQKNAAKFGGDPDEAYAQYSKENPIPQSDFAKVAGLNKLDDQKGGFKLQWGAMKPGQSVQHPSGATITRMGD